MIYYAQRKSILNDEPQAINNRYGGRREMERQFHLFCANACDGDEFIYDVDAIEWGTVDQGALERKVYHKPETPPAPEPEPEDDVNENVESGT